LESETRLFTALTGKQHTLNYAYNLADQPKSVNYAVSQSSGYLNKPEIVEPWREASAQVAMLTAPDRGAGRFEQWKNAENAELLDPFSASSAISAFSAFFRPLSFVVPKESRLFNSLKTETAIGVDGVSDVRAFGAARPIISASALKPGQRSRWRPSPAEAKSPKVVKTAFVRRGAGTPAGHFISIDGRVSTAQGAGIGGVTITVTGGPQGPYSTTTGSSGDYIVAEVWSEIGYTYTVTPSKAGHTFNPTSLSYESPEFDIVGADFTGTPPPTYTISGRVTNSLGFGVSQVTVTLSGTQSGTTTTNGNGDFSFTNLAAGGNYTVTPSKVGYTFTPTNRGYTNLSANVTNSNFTINAPTPPPFTAFNKNVNYAYNAVGTLSGVGTNMIGSDPNATTNVLNSPTFRASGAILGLNYGNGRRLTMGYNANRNQPISMKVDRVSNPSDKILDYVYDYYDPQGKNNNRIRKVTDNTDTALTTDYTYDDYDRLKTASSSFYFFNNTPKTYGYDQWGNTTNFAGVTHNYATNGTGAPTTNRISSDSAGTNFSYDAAGNMTQAGSVTYQYDGAERLKSVNGTSSTYGYDGNGARARVTEWDGVTFYVRSSLLGQVAMEVNSSGVRRAYVYSSKQLVAMQSTDGQFYWLHTNHLRSARAMTNASGNLVYKGQFDPYGQTLTEWSSSGNTNLNTKKFTGYERDASGLDYAGGRMYNSGRGRFMQPDPMGLEATKKTEPQSLNRYSYVWNDPVNFNDPSGMFMPNPASCVWSPWSFVQVSETHGYWERWGTCFEENGASNSVRQRRDGGGQQTTPFSNVRDILNTAKMTLLERFSFSQNCIDGLQKLGISPFDLSNSALSVNIANGPASWISIQNAYGQEGIQAQVGRAAQTQWDVNYADYLANNDRLHMRVQDIFSVRPDISAWTPFGGTSIYINMSILNTTDDSRNQAFIMHELMHNLYGFDDKDIQRNLGIDTTLSSSSITDWLKENCVSGEGNR